MTNETSSAPSLRQRLHDFFYSEEVPYGLALVRIVMPLVLLVPMAPRWLHTRELYSTDGAATPLWIAYGWPDMLPEPSGVVAVILHTALILFLLTMSAGWCTRISCIGATVLYTYINLLDAVSTITKYSCIATHVLLLLCLSRCGAVWSVDALLRRRRRDPLGAMVPQTDLAWPRRLMQLMIGLVYFGAAITKMHTPAFFSGDQMLFWMLAQLNWEHTLGEYLALVPSLIIVSAYISIIWEVTFVFLCWRGVGRVCMISLGIIFHLMTWLTLGLFVFPLVCFAIYFCFFNERDIRGIAAFVKSVRQKLGWEASWSERLAAWQRLPVPAWSVQRSLAAFAAVTVVACTGGVAIEHLRDPYGLRRAEGRYAVQELDREQVRTMLQPTKPIQQKDKIFAFDVGRTLVGGVILDRSKQFRHGESLIAQVHMNPPYEDMWVECYLEDAEQHRVSLVGQSVVAREHPRTNFMHELNPGLPPGDYSVVLLSAGREVARRAFRLLPSVESPVAN